MFEPTDFKLSSIDKDDSGLDWEVKKEGNNKPQLKMQRVKTHVKEDPEVK